MRKRNRQRLRWLAAVVAVLAVLLFAAMRLPYGGGGRQFSIARGMSLVEIGAELEKEGVVLNRYIFAVAAAASGRHHNLQAGTYKFPRGFSVVDVVDNIASGRYIVEISVTIPEGSTLRQMASILRRTLGLDSARFIAFTRDKALSRRLGVNQPTLEGYLLPDTYLFRPDTPAEKIIVRMHDALRAFLTKELTDRMRERMQTLHAVLTMASIVDGETSLAEERARVAGVYYNRLRRGMLLQADPTIQYIIPDGPRRLYYRDLAIASPYNTYRHKGLPPGPINNPGREAIRAALYPEQHQYLFFVATGHGGHTFSTTMREHNLAVQEYRRQRDEAAE